MPSSDRTIATAASASSEARSPRPTPRMTLAQLNSWFAASIAGEALHYHRGYLALDRAVGSRLSREDREELNRVADMAMALARDGRVHLVQRRNGPGDYTYLIVPRSRGSVGRGR